MGRNALLDEILKDLVPWDKTKRTYMVQYEFSRRPSSRFWEQLDQIIKKFGGRKFTGLFITNDQMAALAAMKIITHYKGAARLYAGEAVNLTDLYRIISPNVPIK